MQPQPELRTISKLALGLSIGYVAGILLAPKSGRETRQNISKQISRLRTQASRRFAAGKTKVRNWAKERAQQLDYVGEGGVK